MMDNKVRFTGCTISAHTCRCFDKLTAEEKQLLDDSSVYIQYKKKEMICISCFLQYLPSGVRISIFLVQTISRFFLLLNVSKPYLPKKIKAVIIITGKNLFIIQKSKLLLKL